MSEVVKTPYDATTLKMYILIVDDIDAGHTILGSAHAGLACYLDFQDRSIMQSWAKHSFRKVVCKVTRAQMESAKSYPDHRVMTECAFGDNFEVGIAFCPRVEWPKFFKYLPLYRDFTATEPATELVKCACCDADVLADKFGGVGTVPERKFVCDRAVCVRWLQERT